MTPKDRTPFRKEMLRIGLAVGMITAFMHKDELALDEITQEFLKVVRRRSGHWRASLKQSSKCTPMKPGTLATKCSLV